LLKPYLIGSLVIHHPLTVEIEGDTLSFQIIAFTERVHESSESAFAGHIDKTGALLATNMSTDFDNDVLIVVVGSHLVRGCTVVCASG
jgi:hypothetical protein